MLCLLFLPHLDTGRELEGTFAAGPQIPITNRTSGMVTRKSMFTRKPAVLGTKMEPLALPQAGDVVGMDFSGL